MVTGPTKKGPRGDGNEQLSPLSDANERLQNGKRIRARRRVVWLYERRSWLELDREKTLSVASRTTKSGDPRVITMARTGSSVVC